MKERLKNFRTSGRLYSGVLWGVLALMVFATGFALNAKPATPVLAKSNVLDDSAVTYIYSSERFTPAGNAVTQVPTTDSTNRGSIGIRNEDATYSVYVKFVANGATAPTSTTVLDTIYKLAPGDSRVFDFDSRFDCYVMNSSAGATTSNLYVEQYQGGASRALNTGTSSISGTVSVSEPVSVDDNSGSLTVDNAVLSVVGGGAEATAQRVTIASDSTGVLSVDDNGSSLTVDGTVTIGAGTALLGTISSSPESSTIYAGTTAMTPKFVIIDCASSGDNTILAAVSSKKIRVLGGLLIASAAVTVRFESGASGTALTGQMQLAANAGFQIPYCPLGNFETAATTLLNLELSGNTSVDGWLIYCEVP